MNILLRSMAMLFISSAAIAQPAYTPTVSTGSLAQISFSLLMVLACIVAVAWLLKRMNLTRQGTGNLLKVIGSVAIGQRERVVLVEVNDTWLVVGVGPGQIRTLHTLKKSENWQNEPTVPADNKFANMLTAILKPADRKRNAP
jgi:flagellar protein FliO/FliZ